MFGCQIATRRRRRSTGLIRIDDDGMSTKTEISRQRLREPIARCRFGFGEASAPHCSSSGSIEKIG